MSSTISIHSAIPYKPWGHGYMKFYPDWVKVLELLEAGADPDEVNQFGMNILHLLAGNGEWYDKAKNFKKIRPLILEKVLPVTKGVNVKMNKEGDGDDRRYEIYYGGNTPLHNALHTADIEMVNILLSAGADVNIKNSSGYDAVKYISNNCSVKKKAMLELIEAHKATNKKVAGSAGSNSQFTKADYTEAAKILRTLDKAEIQKQIIDKGMPLNEEVYASSSRFPKATAVGSLALYAASYFKNDRNKVLQKIDDTILYLISKGAEVTPDTDVAEEAISHELYGTLEYLAKNGLDPNKLAENGKSLMEYAKHSPQAIGILLQAGGDPALVPDLLHNIVNFCSIDLLRKLIEEYKLSPTAVSSGGKTLMEAVESFYSGYVLSLYSGYAADAANPKKANKIDSSGKTPAERMAELDRQMENRRYIAQFFPDVQLNPQTPDEAEVEKGKKIIEMNQKAEQEEIAKQKAAEERAAKRDFEYDYYFIMCSFANGALILNNDDKVEIMGAAMLSYQHPVPDNYVVHLCLNSASRESKQSYEQDGHGLEGNCTVFSKRVSDAIRSQNFKNIQLVPVIIRGKKDQSIEGYSAINILKKLSTLDREKSVYKADEYSSDPANKWRNIDKIVLDKEKLSQIPLDERLVYIADEHCGYMFFHKKVVDTILSVNPNNIKAIPVEEWNQGSQFNI